MTPRTSSLLTRSVAALGLILPAAIGVLPAPARAASVDAPAPNIIFFLADDMGIGDTSAYQDLTGNADGAQIATPNLERLANLGTRYTDAHSNAAVCTPTRLALLTGTHAFRSPIRQRTSFESQDDFGTLLQGTRRTVGHMLRDQGYGTYGIGKWHIGMQADYDNHTVQEGPLQAGFDNWTGTPANFPSSNGLLVDNEIKTYDSNFNVVSFDDPDAQPWNASNLPGEGNDAFTERIQQTNLDAAQDYLASHHATRGDDPFFLYYASHSNHTPFLAGDTLDGETVDGHTKAGGYLDVPTTTDANGNLVPTGPLYGNVGLDNHWEPYLQTDADGNVTQHGPGERATLVDENDVAVGKLLDYLENTDDPRNPGHKLIDNTLVVFTSDNGSDIDAENAVGALPQSGNNAITDIAGKKATPDEGGTRVPFIAAWGDEIQSGSTSDALFGLNDMYATFAALSGHELDGEEAADSEDISGALRGDVSGDFRPTSLSYKNRERLIIRDGDFKLIAEDPDADRQGSKFDGNIDYADLEVMRFYDLSNDLGETTNLANDPAHQARIQAMLTELQGFVDDGQTRSGAAANANGVNFQGGDLLDAASYQGYGDGGSLELPRLTTTNPAFVFVDGTAGARVDAARFIQGNGTVSFNGAQAGLSNGSDYELRGGTMEAVNTFRIDDGSVLTLTGGTADFDKQIRFTKGDGLLEISRGDLTADNVTFGTLTAATAGSKVVRFTDDSAGGGTLTLRDTDPLRFGGFADAYVDFGTGTEGQLISLADEAYYVSLWDLDRLRVDGLTDDDLGQTFADTFLLTDLGNGTTALTLQVVPEPGAAALLGLMSALAFRRRVRR